MSLFKAKREIKKHTQKYPAPPEKVFPLLCPVREYEWIDGWNCRMIFSESGLAEEGCVFTTKFPGQEEETTWIMTEKSLENYTVQYLRVTPGLTVLNMKIVLEKTAAGETGAHVTYTYTALTGKGNEYLDSSAEREFRHVMAAMEKSMAYFLQTGQMLKMAYFFRRQT